MARTTGAAVKLIIDTDLSDAIVDAYISGATEVVTEVLGSDTTISSDLKTEIERWLAAHLIASTREQQAIEEGAGGAKIKYQGKTGMGLESTMYGQQVLAMDTTGRFAALGGKRVKMIAISSFD